MADNATKRQEQAHTPGPWITDEDYVFIFGPNSEMVAEMRGDGANLPIEANARLIAAAPKMLEYLEWAMSHVPKRGTETYEDNYHNARTVIRKARGQDAR